MKCSTLIFTALLISFNPLLLFADATTDSLIIVRAIVIRGNETTQESVIRREMSIQIGDTLTHEALDLDRNNIYNLLLFNKVEVKDSVDRYAATIIVTVFERWYFIPFPVFGMKYRDFSKLYYGAGVMHQNFGGRNEKLYITFRLGYDRMFMVNYSNPKLTHDDVFMSTALVLQNVHNLSTEYGEYENSNVFLRGTIGKRFGLYQTIAATLANEVWQVNDLRLGRTVSADGRGAFLSVSAQYRYDARNNTEYTTNGTMISLGVTKSGFGESTVNITTASFDVRKFFGFWSGSAIGFRSHGTFNWGGIIPPYRRVFLGYDERVRGYFYNAVEAENRLGLNAEVRFPILSPRYWEVDMISIPEFKKLRYGLYFGIFADAAKAWWRNQVLSEQPWYSGIGCGFQFLLPYGFTLRTEAAFNNQQTWETFVDYGVSF
jgi:outer membrane protein assembly factor BamA